MDPCHSPWYVCDPISRPLCFDVIGLCGSVPEAMQVFFRTIRGKPETAKGKTPEICNCDVGQKSSTTFVFELNFPASTVPIGSNICNRIFTYI